MAFHLRQLFGQNCCWLCGAATENLINCKKCGNKQFCAQCLALYHKHPKRQNHQIAKSTNKTIAGWSCKYCTFTNNVNINVCAICSETRTVNTDSSSLLLPKSLPENKWRCSFCTLENAVSVHICEACGKTHLGFLARNAIKRKPEETDLQNNQIAKRFHANENTGTAEVAVRRQMQIESGESSTNFDEDKSTTTKTNHGGDGIINRHSPISNSFLESEINKININKELLGCEFKNTFSTSNNREDTTSVAEARKLNKRDENGIRLKDDLDNEVDINSGKLTNKNKLSQSQTQNPNSSAAESKANDVPCENKNGKIRKCSNSFLEPETSQIKLNKELFVCEFEKTISSPTNKDTTSVADARKLAKQDDDGIRLKDDLDYEVDINSGKLTNENKISQIQTQNPNSSAEESKANDVSCENKNGKKTPKKSTSNTCDCCSIQ